MWRHYSNNRITISQMTFSHMIRPLPILDNWKEFKCLVVISWIWLCWRSKKSFPLVWPFLQLQCHCYSKDSSNSEQMTPFMPSLIQSIMNFYWVKMIRIFNVRFFPVPIGGWTLIILETIIEGLVSLMKILSLMFDFYGRTLCYVLKKLKEKTI